MRRGYLHGMHLAMMRVYPEQQRVLWPYEYIKHINLQAIRLEEAHHRGALLLGRQNKAKLLLRGQQQDLIWPRSQTSSILGRTLVVALGTLAVEVSRLLLNANLRAAAKATHRRLAVHLVGAIDAVVLPITAKDLRDAVIVLALELIVPALGQGGTHLIRLVLLLVTIIDAVAQGRVADAQLVLALEGIGMAVDVGTGGEALVAAIQAIIPAIALPTGHDALAIAAAKVIGGAGTVDLVGAIGAVIVAVALVLPENIFYNEYIFP